MSTATHLTTPPDAGDPFALRASSRLATVLLVLAVVLTLFELGSGVTGLVRGRDVTFQGSVSVHADDRQMPSFVDSPGVADVTVHVHDASAKQQVLASVRDLLPILMFVVGLWLLRALLVSARRGEPFNQRNVWRLRGIGALIMLIPVVQIVQHYIDNALAGSVPGLREWPNGGGVAILNGPVAGLVVLALAEVFAYGVRLREDVEGTV